MTKGTKNKNKKKVSTAAPSSANREVARLTKVVNDMLIKERKIRLSPIGKMAFDAGNSIADFFGAGKIFGSGAYKMQGGNSTWDTANQVPKMHSGTDSVTFCHREYLGQISSSSSFTIQQTVGVNPGVPQSFPYLASIANAFQEYRFKGLVYEFKSTSADALNSTNTALGAVMMVAQYRTDAAAPTNKIQVLNEMWSSSSKPSQNCFLPIECNPKECPLQVQYVRSGPVSTVQDAKFYDLATVYVATEGSQATADIGELWATYEVELFKPVMAQTGGIFQDLGWALHSLLASTALPFGVSVNGNSGYNYGLACTYNGSNTITFPQDMKGARFLVTISYVASTSATFGSYTITGGTAQTAYEWTGAVPTTSICSSGSGTSNFLSNKIIECTTDGSMTIAIATTIVGASCAVDVSITVVNDSFL